MLISYQHNFIFIHVAKAAGTSVYQALLPFSRQTEGGWWNKQLGILGPLNRIGRLYLHNDFRIHIPAFRVRRCLPREIYDRAFKFAFVRNPWDRMVSQYNYRCQNTAHSRHETIKALPDFEAYLRWEISHRGHDNQTRYVTDRRGNLIVDFVGRFENLEADFATVCSRLSLPAALPHVNTSKHRDYREYYTPATRDLVAQHFRRDIEMFGYQFGA
jgi:hypothetical protein